MPQLLGAVAVVPDLGIDHAHQFLILLAIHRNIGVLLPDTLHLCERLRQRRLAVHSDASFLRVCNVLARVDGDHLAVGGQ